MDEENIDGAEGAEGDIAAAEAQAKTELENRARRMGWRPREEFRGDPSRWTDAKSFIERGEAELPVLRERYRALDDRFAEFENRASERERGLTDRIREVTSTLQEFREFAKRADERSYARAKADLEAQMAAAVETADRQAYDKARLQIDAMDRERAISPPPANSPVEPPKDASKDPPKDSSKIHPDALAWAAENSTWFGDNGDPTMSAFAVAIHGQLAKSRPGLSMKENLAEVKREVMERFPEKFGNKRREESPAVISGEAGSAPSASKKKGKHPEYKDWPADAKAAFERFKRQMPDYKADEYAKLYFAGAE